MQQIGERMSAQITIGNYGAYFVDKKMKFEWNIGGRCKVIQIRNNKRKHNVASIQVLLHPRFEPTCFPGHLAKFVQLLQQKGQPECRMHCNLVIESKFLRRTFSRFGGSHV